MWSWILNSTVAVLLCTSNLHLIESKTSNEESLLETISYMLQEKLINDSHHYKRQMHVGALTAMGGMLDLDPPDEKIPTVHDEEWRRNLVPNSKNKTLYRNDRYAKICLLKMNPGPCRAGLARYYFDRKKQKCLPFKWGGCQGNANRFNDKDTCLEVCQKKRKFRPSFCYLSFEWGDCLTGVNRYYYDWRNGLCVQRLHSGCGGNLNIFDDFNACFDICSQDYDPLRLEKYANDTMMHPLIYSIGRSKVLPTQKHYQAKH